MRKILVAIIVSIFALQCPDYTMASEEDTSEVSAKNQAAPNADGNSVSVKKDKKKKKNRKKRKKRKNRKSRKNRKNRKNKQENSNPPAQTAQKDEIKIEDE
ncbi:MAG: hypothetical protein LBB12_00005 [Holosporaceae bacterium]|jgi:hypothetical protein|nr:hypothetical protein [Holosporaceae bacterium]